MKKFIAQFTSLNLADKITAFGAGLGVLIMVISIVFQKPNISTQSVIQCAINWFGGHLLFVWAFSTTLGLLFLILQYVRIRRQLSLVFIDDFKKPIEQNWDYVGKWRINHENEMLITGSDQGGLTKKGAFWENYIYTFEVKILSKCIGVIVRAIDSQNYYMFQITTDSIRPHRRVSVPTLTPSKSDEGKFNLSENKVGWLIMDNITLPHNKSLDRWFKVKMYVKGKSIEIYIDNEKVFYKEDLIENSYGRVGFRNDISEEALIRNMKVEII
jgi:hypothetical protein